MEQQRCDFAGENKNGTDVNSESGGNQDNDKKGWEILDRAFMLSHPRLCLTTTTEKGIDYLGILYKRVCYDKIDGLVDIENHKLCCDEEISKEIERIIAPHRSYRGSKIYGDCVIGDPHDWNYWYVIERKTLKTKAATLNQVRPDQCLPVLVIVREPEEGFWFISIKEVWEQALSKEWGQHTRFVDECISFRGNCLGSKFGRKIAIKELPNLVKQDYEDNFKKLSDKIKELESYRLTYDKVSRDKLREGLEL
jgi:hypothetical protein